ncbi:hypothetical protein NECID01_0943 [Nematocida sp. AWRm77]|nr:hypothetical protein NECID01_0943 [Nematocida sp. AWRm77]
MARWRTVVLYSLMACMDRIASRRSWMYRREDMPYSIYGKQLNAYMKNDLAGNLNYYRPEDSYIRYKSLDDRRGSCNSSSSQKGKYKSQNPSSSLYRGKEDKYSQYHSQAHSQSHSQGHNGEYNQGHSQAHNEEYSQAHNGQGHNGQAQNGQAHSEAHNGQAYNGQAHSHVHAHVQAYSEAHNADYEDSIYGHGDGSQHYYHRIDVSSPGYLYSRGAKKYLKMHHSGEHSSAVLVDGDGDTPSLVSFQGHTKDSIPFYSLAAHSEDIERDRYGKALSLHNDRLYLTSRNASPGDPLYFSTIHNQDPLDSEFHPTLPYYDNDRAIKILHKTGCLDVEDHEHLVLRSCVDDDEYGNPSEKNDGQLFVWCPSHQKHLCEKDYS